MTFNEAELDFLGNQDMLVRLPSGVLINLSHIVFVDGEYEWAGALRRNVILRGGAKVPLADQDATLIARWYTLLGIACPSLEDIVEKLGRDPQTLP